MTYEEQLAQKLRIAKRKMFKAADNLRKSGRPFWLEDRGPLALIEDIKASPNINGYRNKVEFTIARDVDQKPCIGFLLGRFKNGVPSSADPSLCLNVSNKAKEVRNLFQSYIEQSDLAPFDMSSEEGFWRQLMVRDTTDGQGNF